jgi:hypothetical protein
LGGVESKRRKLIEKLMQTNERDGKDGHKQVQEGVKSGKPAEKNMSRNKEKLKEKNPEEEDHKDFGGLPDTGNFKKFLGCGG